MADDANSWKTSIHELESLADGRKLHGLRRDFNRYMLHGGFSLSGSMNAESDHVPHLRAGEASKIHACRTGKHMYAVRKDFYDCEKPGKSCAIDRKTCKALFHQNADLLNMWPRNDFKPKEKESFRQFVKHMRAVHEQMNDCMRQIENVNFSQQKREPIKPKGPKGPTQFRRVHHYDPGILPNEIPNNINYGVDMATGARDFVAHLKDEGDRSLSLPLTYPDFPWMENMAQGKRGFNQYISAECLRAVSRVGHSRLGRKSFRAKCPDLTKGRDAWPPLQPYQLLCKFLCSPATESIINRFLIAHGVGTENAHHDRSGGQLHRRRSTDHGDPSQSTAGQLCE